MTAFDFLELTRQCARDHSRPSGDRGYLQAAVQDQVTLVYNRRCGLETSQWTG